MKNQERSELNRVRQKQRHKNRRPNSTEDKAEEVGPKPDSVQSDQGRRQKKRLLESGSGACRSRNDWRKLSYVEPRSKWTRAEFLPYLASEALHP